jgi:DNA-binding transcriptional ArsR family regulator
MQMLESMRRFKAGVFQALAHATRIAILEQLCNGEMSVGQICEKVGVEQANASRHLAILRNKYLVETRKDGNQIFYRLRDPLVGDVLEAMRKFFLAHMNEALAVLKEEQRQEARQRR